MIVSWTDRDLKTHLSWKKCPVLKLAQEIGNKEASKHEAHGQQGRVGVRGLDSVDDNSYVASRVVIDDRLLHFRMPGIFQSGIQMVVIQNQRMRLEGLQTSEEKRY